MFKGTSRRSALDLTYELGTIGAQANAFTSEENTVYYAAVLPEYFGRMQEILSDMLRPALDPEEFRTEKKVILEEIALYQDRPQFYLFERATQDFFSGHTAGNSVLGTTDSISAVEQPDMKGYFDRRYAPGNMVLVAAGNFDWESFIRDAEAQTRGWPGVAASRETPSHEAHELFKVYRRKNTNQSHLVFMSEGSSAQDEERFALGVLALIIGDSSGSRLYWELVDSGLAESAGADNDERDGTGVFMAYASTSPDRVDEVGGILRRILSTPLEFTAADLERAKTKVISKMVLNGELPMGRMMSLGMSWNYRHHVQPLREIVERVKAVTRSRIEQALARYPLTSWAEFRLMPE